MTRFAFQNLSSISAVDFFMFTVSSYYNARENDDLDVNAVKLLSLLGVSKFE